MFETIGTIAVGILGLGSIVTFGALIIESFEKTAMRLHKLFGATLIALAWLAVGEGYAYTQLSTKMDAFLRPVAYTVTYMGSGTVTTTEQK